MFTKCVVNKHLHRITHITGWIHYHTEQVEYLAKVAGTTASASCSMWWQSLVQEEWRIFLQVDGEKYHQHKFSLSTGISSIKTNGAPVSLSCSLVVYAIKALIQGFLQESSILSSSRQTMYSGQTFIKAILDSGQWTINKTFRQHYSCLQQWWHKWGGVCIVTWGINEYRLRVLSSLPRAPPSQRGQKSWWMTLSTS